MGNPKKRQVLIVCTAGKDRSFALAKDLNKLYTHIDAYARGISSYHAKDRFVSSADIINADLILAATSVQQAYIIGFLRGLNTDRAKKENVIEPEVVNLQIPSNWKDALEWEQVVKRAKNSISRRLGITVAEEHEHFSIISDEDSVAEDAALFEQEDDSLWGLVEDVQFFRADSEILDSLYKACINYYNQDSKSNLEKILLKALVKLHDTNEAVIKKKYKFSISKLPPPNRKFGVTVSESETQKQYVIFIKGDDPSRNHMSVRTVGAGDGIFTS